MGAGYSYIDQAMHEQYTWQILAILGALKIVSTGLSFTSGTPGGLFAPTLFMGAMIGGAVGMAERQIVPHLAIPVGAYALVGMGTLFAGILRAPMTSVFMIMEVSGNYSIIVPVIISNAIAYFISRTFQPTPIFDLLSRQDGLELPSLEEEREVPLLRVEDAIITDQPNPPSESANTRLVLKGIMHKNSIVALRDSSTIRRPAPRSAPRFVARILWLAREVPPRIARPLVRPSSPRSTRRRARLATARTATPADSRSDCRRACSRSRP